VRFLRNMLAGVGGVDACVFVVAATEGWKPQSEEHLRILQLIGLAHGLVVLTKIDLVDDEWRELQEMDVHDRLQGTFLADAPIVGVSAATGAGLDRLRVELAALVDRTPAAADRGRPRLWIDRVFAAKGSGTVVTGTLTGGEVATDDHLLAGRHAVRVRSVQSHGARVDRLAAGNRAALNLSGVDHHQLRRGDAVVQPSQWRPTVRFDASLTVLPSIGHVVSRRGAYFAYIGSGEHPVRLRVLGPESIAPGDSGLIRLHLVAPLPLVMGDRFVLRESGRDETVGGGEVLDVAPVLPASRAHPSPHVDRIVAEHGWILADHLWALTGARLPPTVGDWVVDPDALEATRTSLHHRVAAAGSVGVDLAVLDARDRAILPILTDVHVEAGTARLTAERDQYIDHPLLAALEAAGMTPPDTDGVDRALLRELMRRGLVVQREGIVFHAAAVDEAAQVAARLLATRPDGFTMSEFRDSAGITRKYALPLANELDARGITRRRGDVRIAGPRLPPLP
jgi:selenocysteine-specific elongation factor